MDFLNKLLTAGAGYLSSKEQQDAQLELAKLGLQTTQAQQPQPAPAPPAAQIIPGVSNTVVFAAGGGLLLLLGVVVLRRS